MKYTWSLKITCKYYKSPDTFLLTFTFRNRIKINECTLVQVLFKITLVSEWLLFNAISVISWREQVNFQWSDDDVCFVLDQLAELDFYSASWLNPQSAGKHIAPLGGHIILIPSQPVFVLSPYCCVPSGEATNTHFPVFGLTPPGLEPTIYGTRGEHANHYVTDAV